jgi:putative ABC transport system permease protein
MAVAALTTAAGFSASFEHLKETPRLYGVFGDFGGGLPFVGGFDEAIAAMVDDPGLSDVAAGNFREQVYLQGPEETVRANAWGMETLKGSLTPVVTEGSWPMNEGELALGERTMQQLGVRMGDTVKVSSTDAEAELKVVGKAVFGDFGFGPGLGRGAGMTFLQLQALFPADERNLFLANLAPGTNPEDVKGRLDPLFAPLGVHLETVQELKDQGMVGVTITSLGGAQQVPLALSSLLVLAALATLVHVLVTSIRRRRRDLAILMTLGFVRRQVSATVAWQSTALASIALLIGLPLGAAIGRWVWTLFANQIGVISEPVVELSSLLLAIPVTLLLANLIAFIPGRLAARTRPAAALRSE